MRAGPRFARVPCDRGGARREVDRLRQLVGEHRELRLVAERQGEQSTVIRAGEHGRRLAGRVLRGGSVPREPLESREPAQGGAQGSRVGSLAPQARRPRSELRPTRHLPDRVRLDRDTLRAARIARRRHTDPCAPAPPGNARSTADGRPMPRRRARRVGPTRRSRRCRPPRARGARVVDGSATPDASNSTSTRCSSSMRREAGSASTIARRVSS